MKEKLSAIITDALRELNEDWSQSIYESPGKDTPIYSPDSPLDSLQLVSLIATVEDGVADAFGADVVLADERAMSRRRSPFLTVDTLAEYIEDLLGNNTTPGE